MADKTGDIIIKKIKKGGHGHHGGAWKVAYADFVTAMMAFFLLMWLLTSTPVENLEGLADYFSPTVGLDGKMGIGFSGGRSPNTEGVSLGDWASQGLIFGAPPSGPILQFPKEDNGIDVQHEQVSFDQFESSAAEALSESAEFQSVKENVQIESTPEGLRIQITDRDNRPMFKAGSAELLPHTKKVLAKISSVLSEIPNYLRITGYTKEDFPDKTNLYTNWELSTDRANATRRYLVSLGTSVAQIGEIVGKADLEPLDLRDPNASVNSRVSITMLRKELLTENKQALPPAIKLEKGKREGLDRFIRGNKDREERRDRRRKIDADIYDNYMKEKKLNEEEGG